MLHRPPAAASVRNGCSGPKGVRGHPPFSDSRMRWDRWSTVTLFGRGPAPSYRAAHAGEWKPFDLRLMTNGDVRSADEVRCFIVPPPYFNHQCSAGDHRGHPDPTQPRWTLRQRPSEPVLPARPRAAPGEISGLRFAGTSAAPDHFIMKLFGDHGSCQNRPDGKILLGGASLVARSVHRPDQPPAIAR